jgi:sorbose reductase
MSLFAPRPRQSVLEGMSLQGKVVVVTGASRGLGLNIALGLAEVGAAIAGIDIAQEPEDGDWNDLAKFGVKYKYYCADVTDSVALNAAIASVVADFGHIDGCLPVAGIILNAPFLEASLEDFIRTIDVNVKLIFSVLI